MEKTDLKNAFLQEKAIIEESLQRVNDKIALLEKLEVKNGI